MPFPAMCKIRGEILKKSYILEYQTNLRAIAYDSALVPKNFNRQSVVYKVGHPCLGKEKALRYHATRRLTMLI